MHKCRFLSRVKESGTLSEFLSQMVQELAHFDFVRVENPHTASLIFYDLMDLEEPDRDRWTIFVPTDAEVEDILDVLKTASEDLVFDSCESLIPKHHKVEVDGVYIPVEVDESTVKVWKLLLVENLGFKFLDYEVIQPRLPLITFDGTPEKEAQMEFQEALLKIMESFPKDLEVCMPVLCLQSDAGFEILSKENPAVPDSESTDSKEQS